MKKAFFVLLYLLTSLFYFPVKAQNTFTDKRDGHIYRYVTIGNKTWMAENLAYLPHIDRIEDAQFDFERYWVYGYRGNNVNDAKQTDAYKTYGVLYNWVAACKSCPEGWRLPTDAEWMEMEIALGMSPGEAKERLWRRSGDVGKKLMSKEGWKVNFGTNESGFNALPGGMRGYNGFESAGYSGYFWTASPTNGDNGMRRGIIFEDSGINRTEERRYIGSSVRCVKGE